MTSGKRIFDIVFGLLLTVLLAPVILLIALVVLVTSKGPVLFWSDRVGRDNTIFRMPKFRSMRLDTPQVATHLLHDPAAYLTPVGGALRKSSLDELPQLWSILEGSLSFVGPRPALFNQHDLVALRTEAGVRRLTPGLTGWAQINGRDELSIPAPCEKAIGVTMKSSADKASMRGSSKAGMLKSNRKAKAQTTAAEAQRPSINHLT